MSQFEQKIKPKKKQGKGMIFSDLIYVKGLKERLDKNGRPYQTFYFIIGQDMGFMSCTWYGEQKLQEGMCLKLLKGRFCPRKTQQGQVYMNFRVEGFDVWEQPKPTIDVNGFDVEVPTEDKVLPDTKEENNSELSWIDEPDSPVQEEKPKDDGDTLVDISEVQF